MIEQKLHELVELQTLSVPKTVRIPYIDMIDNVEETPSTWEIAAIHRLYPGAQSSQFATLEGVLRQALPAQLIELLSVTNGAELFGVTMTFNSPQTGQKQVTPRYEILSTTAIAERYEEILEGAGDFGEIHDYFEQHGGKMSYIPYCLLRDGNYLAFHIQKQHLFFVPREYNYFPSEIDSAIDDYDYVYVADSTEEWLDRLIQTHGFAGMGGAFLEEIIA